MFRNIEIAFITDKTVLSTSGVEYEVLIGETPHCLIVDQLLFQLKISTLKYGYAVHQNDIIFLREVIPELEILDASMRFTVTDKRIFNLNDIYLFNKFINEVSFSDSLIHLSVKWNKKLTIFSDCRSDNSQSDDHVKWLKNQLKHIKDSDVLDQRFWILLNQTFLDKLKTYVAFWKGKYNVAYDIPNWYQSLYKHTK